MQWQLLFDCNARGVKLAKGDALPSREGDSGCCGVAEAMVRSLEVEGAANVDFGVGTRQGEMCRLSQTERRSGKRYFE